MKPFFTILLLALAGASLAQTLPPKPVPPRLVNDFSNILSYDQKDYLEKKLVAYDDSSSIQIAIVTVKSLQDYEPVDFATKLGRAWGIGNKKTNNGVLVLISTEEGRRKIFISPGYGMEGALPDIICKQIIENDIVPAFKQGNYFRGLELATASIMKAGRGEYKAPEGYRNRGKGEGGSGGFVFLVILLLVIFIIGASRGGGGKGGMMSRRGYHSVPPVLWFPGGGGGGGGFTGGGGGGGGFGGFGGGSFGGGGAGGSW
jgi:uncharacterized protein